jgi:hypothetical protein
MFQKPKPMKDVLLYSLLEQMARNIPVKRNMFSIEATSIARSA